MRIILELKVMLKHTNRELKKAFYSGDMDQVRRLYISRTAILLSLVDEQNKLISDRQAS